MLQYIKTQPSGFLTAVFLCLKSGSIALLLSLLTHAPVRNLEIYKIFDKGNLRILINPCVAVIAAGTGNMGYVK